MVRKFCGVKDDICGSSWFFLNASFSSMSKDKVPSGSNYLSSLMKKGVAAGYFNALSSKWLSWSERVASINT